MDRLRLDKFLSNQLNISRSVIKNQIRKGSAEVNGRKICDPSVIIDADSDKVFYDGKEVSYKKYIYIMMNKPAGILSATEDKSKKTVIDIIPEDLKRKKLFPVGRLDKDTTGLLIITDDGEFSHKCISPDKNVKKVYTALLDGEITDSMIEEFKKGPVLADGTKCKPAILKSLGNKTARITITEGKYHQIKRMFKTVGLGVEKLHRNSIGELKLPDNLGLGECVELKDGMEKFALK